MDRLKEDFVNYNKEKFDLVINDGDMGSNVLAKNRGITSLFVTNQYLPKLWKSRSYFYPGVYFVSKQIAKATRILVCDSAPPYTICEYNLNFPDNIKNKMQDEFDHVLKLLHFSVRGYEIFRKWFVDGKIPI